MKKIGILYYSFTGNVYRMVREFEKGIKEAKGEFQTYKIAEVQADDFFENDILVMASPANGAEEIEKNFFQPFMKEHGSKFQGKEVFLFGSYGWGGGKYLSDWKKQLIDLGAVLIEPGIVCNGNPNSEIKQQLQEMGRKIAI